MKNVTKTNALFAFMIVFYLLSAYVIAILPVSIPEGFMQVIPELILLIPCLMYIFWMKPDTVKDISYAPVSVGTVFKVILITYLLMPMMMFINGVSSMFVENNVVTALEKIAEQPLWLKVVNMAVIPAVVEEFIFRGLIFHGLKRRNPFWAIIISAFLFGLMHMNINQFLYAFAMGVFFAMITYATGSMWPSMVMHFIYNAQSVVLSHIILKYGSDVLTETGQTVAAEVDMSAMILSMFIVYAVLFGIALGGAFLAMLLYFNICKKNRGDENVKRIFTKPFRKQFDDEQGKFVDGYFIFAVILCILYMILGEIG